MINGYLLNQQINEIDKQFSSYISKYISFAFLGTSHLLMLFSLHGMPMEILFLLLSSSPIVVSSINLHPMLPSTGRINHPLKYLCTALTLVYISVQNSSLSALSWHYLFTRMVPRQNIELLKVWYSLKCLG